MSPGERGEEGSGCGDEVLVKRLAFMSRLCHPGQEGCYTKRNSTYFRRVFHQIIPSIGGRHEDRNWRHLRVLVKRQYLRVCRSLILLHEFVPGSNSVPIRSAFGPVHVLVNGARDPDDGLDRLG